jgi:hypothetical protein
MQFSHTGYYIEVVVQRKQSIANKTLHIFHGLICCCTASSGGITRVAPHQPYQQLRSQRRQWNLREQSMHAVQCWTGPFGSSQHPMQPKQIAARDGVQRKQPANKVVLQKKKTAIVRTTSHIALSPAKESTTYKPVTNMNPKINAFDRRGNIV